MHTNLTRPEIEAGIDTLSDRLRDAMADMDMSPVFIKNATAALKELEGLLKMIDADDRRAASRSVCLVCAGAGEISGAAGGKHRCPKCKAAA